MKYLAKNDFKFIVISNQAGVARGMVQNGELERIHKNMKNEFQKECVEILDIYVCPHHWEEGCFCRKPSPGMLFQASKEHLFRLDKTLFIGDDPRDCQTAEKAGCNSIFIGKEAELKNLTNEERPIYSSSSMLDSIDTILNHYQV
jgi:histidinol-phosphate phosphatase family protein